ncbi:MAG TPA: response regulator [Terriglobales bacterium]|nr:response regulator [Terriglobales bacterium]
MSNDSTKKLTILCIDDDQSGLLLRKLLLEAEGYDVLTADGGRSGLLVLENQRVDAVILDYAMPAMNGGEVAGVIRHKWPSLPIVMLSGYTEDVPGEIRALVNAFVSKGDSTPELLNIIQQSMNGRDTARLTILNVDDNQGHRYALTRVLKDAGFDVIEATTGNEALNRALSRPNLILLDVNLPDMLGFDVCRHLKSNPVTRDIPIIHISATYPSEVAREESKGSGASRFIPHPRDVYEVVSVINQELGSSVKKRHA